MSGRGVFYFDTSYILDERIKITAPNKLSQIGSGGLIKIIIYLTYRTKPIIIFLIACKLC